MPTSTPKFPDVALVDLVIREDLPENQTKFSFTVNGTSLTSIFIRPKENAELVAWSFLDSIPEVFNKTYFISIANGVDTEPFKFDLTLKSRDNSKAPILDLTLVSMKFDRQRDYTTEFKNVLKRVPDWAFAQDCIGAVTSYVY